MSDSTATPTAPSIREALVEDAWVGHDETLTEADVAAIAESASKAAAAIVEGQYDGFLESESLDPAWIAGWHAAMRHAAHRLRSQTVTVPLVREILVGDAWVGHDETLTEADVAAIADVAARAVAAIVDAEFDGFPAASDNLDPAWIAGWHSATRHAAHRLRYQGVATA